MNPALRLLDTFSGIGGFSLAARWLGGFETVQFVERDPYCQRVLAKHWPTVPIHDDICTFNPEHGTADVVVGGFPCQDISTAGKGAGLAGERSGLFYELLRVIRLVGPRYVVLENVAAILGRGLDDVLGALAEAGYDCEWACIPASAVGACHQRDRWWAVAYPSSLRGERRGAPINVASTARAGEVDSQQRQWNGNAVNDCGPTPDPLRQRLQGPHQLAGRRPQWPAAPKQLSPDWGGYVSQPVLRRGDDGLSGRVDRLKALGNAVVPQVAMVPLVRVLELDAQAHSREPLRIAL